MVTSLYHSADTVLPFFSFSATDLEKVQIKGFGKSGLIESYWHRPCFHLTAHKRPCWWSSSRRGKAHWLQDPWDLCVRVFGKLLTVYICSGIFRLQNLAHYLPYILIPCVISCWVFRQTAYRTQTDTGDEAYMGSILNNSVSVFLFSASSWWVLSATISSRLLAYFSSLATMWSTMLWDLYKKTTAQNEFQSLHVVWRCAVSGLFFISLDSPYPLSVSTFRVRISSFIVGLLSGSSSNVLLTIFSHFSLAPCTLASSGPSVSTSSNFGLSGGSAFPSLMILIISANQEKKTSRHACFVLEETNAASTVIKLIMQGERENHTECWGRINACKCAIGTLSSAVVCVCGFRLAPITSPRPAKVHTACASYPLETSLSCRSKVHSCWQSQNKWLQNRKCLLFWCLWSFGCESVQAGSSTSLQSLGREPFFQLMNPGICWVDILVKTREKTQNSPRNILSSETEISLTDRLSPMIKECKP